MDISARRNILMAGGGFVGLSVVAGVLVAAIITPALAVTSEMANASVGVFNNLPDYITIGQLSQQNEIFATRDGKQEQIATIYDQNRESVGPAEISSFLKDAAVAGEDRRFFEHGGVDVPSIVRAAVGNVASQSITSGSSTLDMQLVKNILVQRALEITDPAARKAAYASAIGDDLARKLKEMKLAIGLDKKYSKVEILNGYLNITGFGGNTYGVQAAAQQYFSVGAKDVTLAQAASLVAIVQQPSFQNLSNPKYYPANKLRRDQILYDMYDLKYVTKAQFDEAMATPIAAEVKLSSQSSGCLYALSAKFACDYMQRLVPTLTALGSTPAERQTNWARGGYKIFTSIDLSQQDVATAALVKDAPPDETRFNLGAAAVAVQPGTGRILVMAQNKGFDNSGAGGGPTTTAINYNTDRAYGGSSGFQTGSTYKIFTLADWLQNGHGLYESVSGTVRTFPFSSFSAPCTRLSNDSYTPSNDSPGEGGSMSVLTATKNSVNAAFVGMAQKLDLCAINADATAMGVHRADGTPLRTLPSEVLGTNEIAPLTMAGAIATIGSGGTYCAPTIVDTVTTPSGESIPGQPADCTAHVIAPNIAATEAFALASVMTSGTGTAGNPKDGVPIVGKTGTTDTADQNWLIATTTKAALAVWVGNTSGKQNLRHITVAGTNGYNTKFNIFKATMTSINTDAQYRGGDFPKPDQALLYGSRVTVPDVSGESVGQADSVLASLGFSSTDGGAVASDTPAGTVVRTDPAAGSLASAGAAVTVYTSDGSSLVTMPNEIGASRSAAVNDLASVGFSDQAITYNWVPGDAATACRVVATAPAAGARITANSSAVLTVSNGRAVAGIDPGARCP